MHLDAGGEHLPVETALQLVLQVQPPTITSCPCRPLFFSKVQRPAGNWRSHRLRRRWRHRPTATVARASRRATCPMSCRTAPRRTKVTVLPARPRRPPSFLWRIWAVCCGAWTRVTLSCAGAGGTENGLNGSRSAVGDGGFMAAGAEERWQNMQARIGTGGRAARRVPLPPPITPRLTLINQPVRCRR
jgi:hypothetical protein